ncbi:MAG: glycoside hydrolase family 3 C-terminal domain-containing protein [Oscillospiraceae bacterium]|nr:glycoside hydrolase family 3 C-terminal domain-containing protein [Oscillospiraceae bacterium]
MSKTFTLDWNAYTEAARKTAAEGCVLLKNDNNALPLEKDCRVSVFGRIQLHYYKSGTGSGGMVNISKVYGIFDGLHECGGVIINDELTEIYRRWEEGNPFNKGIGWGAEPWSQEEMPLDNVTVESAAKKSDAAIVIIGRTAGEDMDNKNEEGAYLLSAGENDMLEKVRAAFKRVIVLLNVGTVIDMSFIDKYSPDAVMYVWQGGMVGGLGTADVLTGNVSPSGKLTDTIAYSISDYPSAENFGDDERNFYKEDIYVGYRYFETFAKDKVRYPFGFGLSYTDFEVKTVGADVVENKIILQINVRNTGNFSGKEVVQIYSRPPQGKLGKPLRSLISFKKTDLLVPGEEQTLLIEIDCSYLASYDDSGITEHKSCFVLEAGTYEIYVGTNVRNAERVLDFVIQKLIVTEQLEEALAPVLPFKRLRPVISSEGNAEPAYEDVPISTADSDIKRLENLPTEIPQTGMAGICLADVYSGKASVSELVAQMNDEDLSCIIRGEGMGSPKVTPGTAAAFGGVNDNLKRMGIPAVCCDDGPSGMRLDCGMKAFSLPNGTMIASTFNPDLINELFRYTALEMISNKVECLLGPGMNIHRFPLNGRNFEYFSEDPYLTGIIACAELQDLHSMKVTGTIKHFCGNNQEHRRHFIDTVVSERALREIYLRGFEMAVKNGGATSIMTTYGAVNGLWTAGSYDLNTTILRKEWGFKGIVMTDWFASINERGKPQNRTNLAAMVRSQNDLYMVCGDASKNSVGDNTLESLANGSLTRGELQRSAENIVNFAIRTAAFDRIIGESDKVEIINRPKEDYDCDISDDFSFVKVDKTITVDLSNPESVCGTNYIMAFELKYKGKYCVTLTGSSELGELAQIPCTLFYSGIPIGTFTFSGSGGKDVALDRLILLASDNCLLRLNVGQNGVRLKNIRFDFEIPIEDIPKDELYF